VTNAELRELLRKAQRLIAANRLMLGHYSGVREVGSLEDSIDAALTEEECRPVDDPQVAHADLYSMLVGQVRYSLGRRSYVVGDACSQVRRYWRHLREGERTVIERDVVEELARYERMGRTCGDACDQAEWERLVAWMVENKAV
jgi:hypothetical protein